MRRAAIGLVIVLAACSTSTPAKTASSTVGPTSTSGPSSTLPPGVGLLCDHATGELASEALSTYGGKVPGAAYGKSRFADLLAVTLKDCATRIEWLTAMEAHITGAREGPLDAMFGLGCDKERLGQEVATAVGDAPTPLPVACG